MSGKWNRLLQFAYLDSSLSSGEGGTWCYITLTTRYGSYAGRVPSNLTSLFLRVLLASNGTSLMKHGSESKDGPGRDNYGEKTEERCPVSDATRFNNIVFIITFL